MCRGRNAYALIPGPLGGVISAKWTDGMKRERDKTTTRSSGGGTTFSFDGSIVDRGMARIGSFPVAAYNGATREL
jgi:N-methylhydantoinase A/oxoprolinase/acetone carboxylase beta subunit